MCASDCALFYRNVCTSSRTVQCTDGCAGDNVLLLKACEPVKTFLLRDECASNCTLSNTKIFRRGRRASFRLRFSCLHLTPCVALFIMVVEQFCFFSLTRVLEKSVWLDVHWEDSVTASLLGNSLTHVHTIMYDLMPYGKTLWLSLFLEFSWHMYTPQCMAWCPLERLWDCVFPNRFLSHNFLR